MTVRNSAQTFSKKSPVPSIKEKRAVGKGEAAGDVELAGVDQASAGQKISEVAIAGIDAQGVGDVGESVRDVAVDQAQQTYGQGKEETGFDELENGNDEQAPVVLVPFPFFVSAHEYDRASRSHNARPS